MEHIIFHRESNKFDDILQDPTIKKNIRTKISFRNYLILNLNDDTKIMSYAILKYGDDVVTFNSIAPDRTPIPNKDYTPQRKPKRTKKL